MARVTAHVHVASRDGTRRAWLSPGDTVPDWATVSNPAVLDGGAPPRARQSGGTASTADSSTAEAPPRAGRGSGLEPWQRFAEAHGVGVDSGMARDDVIAACESAGVIPEEG